MHQTSKSVQVMQEKTTTWFNKVSVLKVLLTSEKILEY